MADVTDADRATAMRVMEWHPLSYDNFVRAVAEGWYPYDRNALETVDRVAQALADEREKALAPVLALAECWAKLDAYRDHAATMIRRAAGQQP